MAVGTPQAPAQAGPGGIRGIEVRSIDWVPESERHGKLWHQLPLWFLGNFQYFSIPIGFVGPALGLSLWWTIVAGTTGILTGTVFMAFHATQGPTLGLPQMIQSRAQFGYRGVVVALFATFFTYLAFNVADQVLMSEGLNGAFGWNANVIAVVTAIGAALLAIYGHDWVHRVFRGILFLLLPLMVIVTIGVITGACRRRPLAHLLRLRLDGVHGPVLGRRRLQHHVCAVCLRLLPLPAQEHPARAIIASVFAGASTPAIWLIALGAWLAIRLGATDGLVGLQTAGNNMADHLGSVTAFLSATALAATMGMNAYGGMLTVLTGVDSFRKVNPTRLARIVTIVVPDRALVRDRQVDHDQRRRCGVRLADADALPAGAVDGDEPDRLLLRPPRPLRDHRPVQAARHLRGLGVEGPDRLHRRLRRSRCRSWYIYNLFTFQTYYEGPLARRR